MSRDILTRRRVLTGVGAAGVAAFAGLGAATEDSVRYTYASSHSCEDFTLDAEWRETYTTDGETSLLENTTASSGGQTGTEPDEPAVIYLQNVMPGDRGTVSFRITADALTNDTTDTTVEPTLTLILNGTPENDINDPEEEAGDSTSGPDQGELQEFLDVKMWKDTGLLGIDVLGGDNLEHDIGEPTISEGTLEQVANDVNDEPLNAIDTDGEDSVSVTFRWRFDPDNGDVNITQGDAVKFTFDIGCQ